MDHVNLLEENFKRISSLQEMATFEIALQLWCLNGIEEMVNQYCPVTSEIIGGSPKMEDIVKMIRVPLHCLYPKLPVFMVNSIIHAVKSIGNEIQAWKRVPHLDGTINVRQISPKNYCWSSSRTNDRPKTACVSKKFNLDGTKMCQCCWDGYVKALWYNTDATMQRFYTKFFGPYKYYALIFEKFYLEHFLEVNVVQQYFNPDDTPLENIFHLSVYFVYNEAVVHYWCQLDEYQQTKNINKAIDIFFDSCYSNNINERKTSTFTFLWNKLGTQKRTEIMDCRFYHVLRLLLPWPMTEYLVPVLNFNQNVDYEDPIYVLLLHETAKRIPRGFHKTDPYRHLFTLLCSRALAALKVYRVQHLILTLLEYPEDLDMAVNLMTYYDYRKKKRISTDLFSYPGLVQKPLIRSFIGRVRMNPRSRFRRMNYMNR
ncbi:uncharacterized protein LOC135842614 [Planococcus citri]|uniref:uncharacterized protein LOC135842614 n=1 Tax=Planococcus citri TaxID=170843 RepID=UPI0031F9EFC9